MLLQSHEENTLRLLPALPKQWKSGSIKGLKARGDIKVDITWENNQLSKAVFYSKDDKQFDLIIKEQRIPVKLKMKEALTFIP